ncbi:MAG: spermidine synthase-like protein [Opitutaceae bacterium]
MKFRAKRQDRASEPEQLNTPRPFRPAQGPEPVEELRRRSLHSAFTIHHSSFPVALALLSAGVTAAQLALMQLLSYVQWHHFAYLVVALALLGFGASGTLLTLCREWLLARASVIVPWLMIGTGAGFAAVAALLQTEFLRFDLYLLFVDRSQWLRLATACLLLAAPFFCAGLATGMLLTAGVERAGRLYFANLAGSGAGALGGLALLGWFEPARLPAITAMAPLAGALILHAGRRDRRGMIIAAALVLAAAGASRWAPPLTMSPFKDLARTLDLPEARVIASQPGAQGWLQVVAAPAIRGGPPADLAFAGTVPHQHAVFVDGNRYGSLLADAPDGDALAVFDASPESLPWRLGAPRRVLLLREGAAGEAAFANIQGATEIVMVEPHRAFAKLLAERWDDNAGITVEAGEPRAALARASNAFDLIRLPSAGTFGGSAGLRAIAEEFLYTREAVAEAWRALTEDGTLLVTAWMDHPERTPLRLLATLRAGLLAAGVRDVTGHLAAVRGWASVTFLLRRSALEAEDVAAIRGFCSEHGFDPLVLPRLEEEERTFHHAWDNPAFFRLVDAILEGNDESDLIARYPFRLDAPTDERPYFSQFLRPGSVLTVIETLGVRGVPFFELGSIIVAVTLALLLVLATACIALPLARRGWRRSEARAHRGWTFGYFAALGAGFMLIEIVVMLRLTPFAGGAVPAAAVVLATLLFVAGVGSHISQRFPARRGALMAVTTAVAGGILALGLVTATLPFAWEASLPWRAGASALLIAPVAFVMGMAFPTGLRLLAADAPAQLPWAWAVNSCLSVVTPSIAMLLAVSAGYSFIFWLAALIYLAAALVTFVRTKK